MSVASSVAQLMKEMDEVMSTGSKAKNAAVAALEAKAAAALAQKQAAAAAKEAERAAAKAAKAAEKEIAAAAKKAEKAAAKEAKAAEKEAAKAAKAAEKAAKPKKPVGRPRKTPPASVAEAPVLLAADTEHAQAHQTVQALRAAESELRARLAAMEKAYHSALARLDAVRQLVAV